MFQRSYVTFTCDGEERRELRSATQVEDVYAREPERAVLALVLSTVDLAFYNHCDATRTRHFHQFVMLDQGEHFGDCTHVACSCSRCIAECAYEDTLVFEQEVGSQHPDPVVLVLATEAILGAAMEAWRQGLNLKTGMHTSPFPDTSAAARLALWATLSAEAKQDAERRAAQFRTWIKDKKLPPYPADWPENWPKLSE